MFLTPAGGLIDADNLRHRVWLPALRKAGLRHVTQHSLRHTFASMLIGQGESVKYVQQQLGHASAVLTLNTYSHLFPVEKRTSPARLEAQLAAGRAPTFGLPLGQTDAILSNTRLTETAETGESTEE